MMNNTIKKWETLITTLTVAKKSSLICSEVEIERAEKELGFKFPVGYKEYCRVFGSGSLGQGDAPTFFRVYCPCCPQTLFDIRHTGHNLIGLKIDVEAIEPIEDVDKAQLLYRLLDYGYVFGDSDRADRFIWDITTYSEEDQSYDIYWIPDEEAEEITLVGRNFFDFLDKFCLGTGWKIMFPEEYLSDMPETQERFFTALEQYTGSNSADSFTQSTLESFWDGLASNEFLTEKSELKLNCTYNAKDKEQAECLERTWSRDDQVEIEIIAPSKRPHIPRLLEITVTVEQINRESVEGILRKMIRIGKECDCQPSNFGSAIHPKN